jgi:putative DNA primase/helicase
VALLQEWMGYCLTHETRLQKILLLVGPPRAGKGTIARVLTSLIGTANVCGPTLASLATNFGLWPWIGKQLAIISDARLSGRSDQAIITERLLAISGEDGVTIDRKNLEPLTTKLPTRIMVISNELPRLTDASGALANRFLVLKLSNSYLGREDTGLLDRLLPELPAILNWALAGLARLRARGHFAPPAAADDAVLEMADLASPVGAFVRDWCRVRPGIECPTGDLYGAFKIWCREQGNAHPPDCRAFGRDLSAACPGLSAYQPRDASGRRYRAYRGIDLTLAARETLNYAGGAEGGS